MKLAILQMFKVLVNHRSCHGGSFRYPPIGVWTPRIRETDLCRRGYHLTSDPLGWWLPRAELWVADARAASAISGGKGVFTQVRLVRRITDKTPNLAMFPRLLAFIVASARSDDPNYPLGWANLSRANLSGANLFRANLSGADLFGANLSRANLSGANLSETDLSGASLSGADLSGTNLSETDLSGASLSGASLSRANLSGADLSGANLSKTDLFWANLSRANLSGANLSGANLSGTEGYNE